MKIRIRATRKAHTALARWERRNNKKNYATDDRAMVRVGPATWAPAHEVAAAHTAGELARHMMVVAGETFAWHQK